MQSSSRAVGILALACAVGVPTGIASAGETSDLPDAFEQIIPRGRIASIDAPRFVKAAEAEIPDDAWVLGVASRGEAKAYSLNLLNHHEIVNDRIGDLPVAAVW